MATSVVFPRVQFFANNGRPLVGGRIHTYFAGSSTRARTYQDAAKVQPNANPIILDARGEAAIYLAEGVEYKFVIEDSKGALIMTQEPVYGAIWPNAAEWPSDATLSYQYMTDAKAAAGAIGPVKFYDTYAQALAAVGSLASGDLIEVSQDETRAGARTRYKVQAGALVFVVNLDQTKLDLAAATGASLVGFQQAGTGAVPTTVQSKLREFVSVKDFGASPLNTGAQNTSAIRSAIAEVSGAGGGKLLFESGTYLLASNFNWASNLMLIGTGATVLKIQDGVDSTVVGIADQSTTPAVTNIGAIGIIFDGNGANAPGLVARSAVLLDPVDGAYFERCNFRNARGYGVSLQYNIDTIPNNARCKNIVFVRCDFHNNGAGMRSGGTTYDGIDVKNCNGLKFFGCRAYDNSLDGFDFRGENIDLIACEGFNNGGSGVEISANTNGTIQNSSLRIIGGSFYSNLEGVAIANNPSGGSGLTRLVVSNALIRANTAQGIRFFNATNTNTYAVLESNQIFANGSIGIDIPSASKHVSINNCEVVANVGDGVYVNGTGVDITGGFFADNGGWGYREGSGATRNNVAGTLRLSGNVSGGISLNSASRLTTIAASVRDYTPNSGTNGDIIASAATITLPEGGNFFAITGTSTITAITPSFRGRVVTLIAAGLFSMADGSSLRLSGNYTATADDTITITCDGSTWFELCRSAN